MATQSPQTPQKILIIRLSAIGDVVCTLPLLETLRTAFPKAQIDWVVDQNIAELLQGHPAIRRVLLFPRKGWAKNFFRPLREHLRVLRYENYDVILDAQGNLKSSINTFFARGKRKIGFASGYSKEGSFLFVRERVTPPGKKIHRVDKYLSLVGPLGITNPGRPLPPPPIDPVHARRVDQFLEREELNQVPFAILHPGTSLWGRDKQWPPERFGALAEKIRQELGLIPIVTWGPGEKPLAERVAANSNNKARVSFPTQNLKEFVALVSRCSLFIAGDTGALQIASFLGKPSVGIFGPTDPVIYGPIGPRSLAVQPSGLIEAPETRDRSAVSDLMKQISVEQVFEMAKALWDARENG